jgi:modulator of FtsH protease HflK
VSGRERIERTVTGVRTAQLGTSSPDDETGPILWTTPHARSEVFNIIQSSAARGAGGPQDLALLAVEVPLKYVVEDTLVYEKLGPIGMRDELLEAVGRRAVTRFLAHRSLDEILGPGRAQLGLELEAEVTRAFSELNPDANGTPRGAGVRILSVGVAGVHPPRQVASKFEQVVIAQTNRESMIEDARRSEIESLARVVGRVDNARLIVTLIDELERLRSTGADEQALLAKEQEITEAIGQAEGLAAELLARARADRWTKHMQDRGALVNYQGQIAALEAAPGYFVAKHYFDALSQIFDTSRIFVVPDRETAEELVTQIDLTESRTGAEIFDPNSTVSD